jgi:CO/xanthine dehydrogenase Mo-binding subunit
VQRGGSKSRFRSAANCQAGQILAAVSLLIDVVLVPSGDAPGGVGEPGTRPVAAAVTNALFVLTGQRIRRLPIRLA